jgi:hypothetical protein
MTAYVPSAPSALGLRGRVASAAPWLRVPRPTSTGWLALVTFAASLAAGYWVREELGYIIGDTLARTGNAVYVSASRDPHAGAVGFYWPPVFSLAQIPFVVVLRLFDAIEWAGPIVSAIAHGATVALLGRLGRRLGVGRWTTFGICAAYGLNPVMLFYGGNGMSETTSFAFLVLALDGYVRWCRDDRNGPLATCSMALAGLVMVRTEAVLIVILFAVCGAYAGANLRRSLNNLVLIALPAAFAFVVWMATQLLLLNDALYFLHTNLSPSTVEQQGLPNPADHRAVARWALQWLVFFGPVLVLTLVTLAVRLRPGTSFQRGAEVRVVALLWGLALVFPALHGFLLLRGSTTGNPRYFLPITVVATVGALWCAAGARLRLPYRVLNAVLVGGLVATACVSVVVLRDPDRTKVEQESFVFDSLVGKDRSHDLEVLGQGWQDFRDLADDIDRVVPASSRILADSTYAFPLVVYSQRRSSFVIPNDRDFEPTLADPEGKVDHVVVADEAFLRVRFGGRYSDPVGDVVRGSPDRWRLVSVRGSMRLFVSVDGLLRARPAA